MKCSPAGHTFVAFLIPVSRHPAFTAQALVLGEGDHVTATTDSQDGLKFLLIAGKPIGEPIVQHGPFVMNTQAEIQKAFEDYHNGVLQNPTDNPWQDEL